MKIDQEIHCLPYARHFVKGYIALDDANCLRAAVVLDDSFWPAEGNWSPHHDTAWHSKGCVKVQSAE